MELSNFPNLILYKIFRNLPLKDLFQMRRLNKQFHQISSSIISETKSLDLTQRELYTLSKNPESFLVLLKLCSERLEKIHFPCFDRRRSDEMHNLQKRICDFSFPCLIELKFAYFVMIPDELNKVLQRNPNLEILIFDDIDIWNPMYTIQTNGPVCENLKKLKAPSCDEYSMKKFIGRCPNLKCFKLNKAYVNNGQIFEQFFQTHKELENFKIEFLLDIDLEKSINFWKLESMRKLNPKFNREISNNNLLTKISQNFPLLESLKIFEQRETGNGIGDLRFLKNLKKLKLVIEDTEGIDVDGNLRRVAVGCTKLRVAHFELSKTTSASMVAFVHFCPDLKFLDFHEITDIVWIDECVEFVRNFNVIENRILRIAVFVDDTCWTSIEVEKALAELGKENGQIISFQINGYYNFPWRPVVDDDDMLSIDIDPDMLTQR